MKSLGRHLLIELFDCKKSLLNDIKKIETFLIAAVKKCGATVIDSKFHKFSPHGVSGVIVIAESHCSIHTWPEYGFASIDIYTCGEEIDPWNAYKYMVKIFKAKNATALEIKRGMLNIHPSKLRHKPLVK